jgi:hypothetical protein
MLRLVVSPVDRALHQMWTRREFAALLQVSECSRLCLQSISLPDYLPDYHCELAWRPGRFQQPSGKINARPRVPHVVRLAQSHEWPDKLDHVSPLFVHLQGSVLEEAGPKCEKPTRNVVMGCCRRPVAHRSSFICRAGTRNIDMYMVQLEMHHCSCHAAHVD